MQNQPSTAAFETEVPLLNDVDVLIVGSSSASVAAALEAKAKGASVAVVSDLSYFGEESAGALRLQPKTKSDDVLFRQLFPDGTDKPATPRHVKHQLELALLDAGIPFYFFARPVALLRDQSNRCTGAVIASRTSLYAIGAKCMVDASRYGVLAHLFTEVQLQQRELSDKISWTVLSPDAPTGEDFQTQTLPEPFELKDEKGELFRVPAHVLTFDRPSRLTTTAQRAGMEHQWRCKLEHMSLWGMAEILPDHSADCLKASALSDDPKSISVEHCQAQDQLFVLNGLLPLSVAGLEQLEQPAVQIALGRQVGAGAAEAAIAWKGETNWANITADTGNDDAVSNLSFAPVFVRKHHHMTTLSLKLDRVPRLGHCDVTVAGGGTGGAPAGVAAARAGASTVVLEIQHGLGGVGTIGFIASYYHGNRVGYSNELDCRVSQVMQRDTQQQHKRWNPHIKNLCLQQQLLEAGGIAWLGSFAYGVQREGDKIVGLLVSTPFGCGLLKTKAVVDATGSADVAAAAGAPCRVIDAYHAGVQGAGLAPARPGQDYRNSDHTFIDDADLVGVTHAFVNARAKFPHEFDVSTLVDSRERRQIIGDVELSPLDFLAKRTFPDTINVAKSNFDTHGFTVHPVFVALPPDRKPLLANVPFRCLLPQGVANVLVTGLGMSAHRDAIPVVRMQADVQNQGYAAGVAAARSAASGVMLRQLNLRDLQRHLIEVGNLEPDVLEHQDTFPLTDEQIQTALKGGIDNQIATAIIIAHPQQSMTRLRELLDGDDAGQQEHAALLLGLMGQSDAAPALAEIVRQEAWDEGWNYRGMGQFGMSMSRVDCLLVALGKTGSSMAVDPLVEKIGALDGDAAFSHCRAVSIAAAALGEERASQALVELLNKPGIQGHAQLDSATVIRQANADLTETEARNLSLRELLLARGLYLSGDIDALGKRILETYAQDLRGVYARHAQAVLSTPTLDKLQVM